MTGGFSLMHCALVSLNLPEGSLCPPHWQRGGKMYTDAQGPNPTPPEEMLLADISATVAEFAQAAATHWQPDLTALELPSLPTAT
jgi:hypothetical protein